MRPKSFPSLGLRDGGYLQSSASWAPDPADPDLQGWWKASEYLDIVNSTIGDKTDVTVNKTSLVAPNWNLSMFPGCLAVLPTGTDVCNYIFASQQLTSVIWLTADATKNDDTHITFSAQNGRCLQYHQLMAPGEVWKLTITARRVTGNTNIEILHQDSATGTATGITLTGVLADYTVTFNGPAAIDTLMRIGVRDPNAAGHGQIEVTKWHLRRSEHSNTYVQTDTTQLYRKGGTRQGVPAFSTPSGAGGGAGTYFRTTATRTNALPFTLYMSVWLHSITMSNAMALCQGPTVWGFLAKADISGAPAGRLASYVNVAPFAWVYSAAPNVIPEKTWCVLCFVSNGANSEQRYNLNAATAVAHPAGSPGANGWAFGSDSTGGGKCPCDFHEIILAYSAHDTATQDQYIAYLADQVGITP